MSGFPGHANRPSGGASTGPQYRWWVPGTGINRSVITSEIQQYLGADALVRPGKGAGDNQGIDGYWISAYRNLTSEMLLSLKEQSVRYEKTKEPAPRFQESHHDPRNPALRPTPPLLHGGSAYPPPTAPSPYGQEQGYAPPRQGGQPAGFGAPSYSGPPDPRDPYYQQNQQPPYPSHGQPEFSPNAPQYAHPHYTTGTPVTQADGSNYYPSPPAQYAPQSYPPVQGSTPRQNHYPPGYTGPPQPGYSYQTAPAASSNTNPGYSQPYPQGGHHPYR